MSSLLKNAYYNTVAQIVTIILNLLFVPLYISHLTVGGYGLYSFIVQLLGWMTILQMGVEPAVVHLAASCNARGQKDRLSGVITMALMIQLIMSATIATGIFFFKTGLINFILKDQIQYLREGLRALNWALLNIVVVMLYNVFNGLMKGLERYDLCSMFFIINNFVTTMISALAVWLGYGLSSLLIIRFFMNSFFLIIVIALSMYKKWYAFSMKFHQEAFADIFRFGSWIVVGRLNRLALSALPQLLIGKYIGPNGIAYFNISTKIVSAVNNLLASATNVLFPYVSRISSLGEVETVRRDYLKANKMLSTVSAPFYVFLSMFSWYILKIWIGTEMADSCWTLMVLLTVGYYLSTTTMIPTNFALGLGKSRLIAINALVQAAVVVIALPVMLGRMGLKGSGVNLILFETVGVVTGLYITTVLIKASAFRFWIVDRMLFILMAVAVYLPFLELFKYLLTDDIAFINLILLGGGFCGGFIFYYLILERSGIVKYSVRSELMNRVRKESI